MSTLRKSLFSLASAVAVLLLTAAAQATTLNVPSQYASIQAAINAAAIGDTILVAAGTYHESLSWISKDLTIQGAGEGMSMIDPSAAHGGPGGRCLFTQNLSAASRINGFTFQNGSGSGMYNFSSSPGVTDCAFTNNSTFEFGGGMENTANSSPNVTSCTFTQNAAICGGGMDNDASNPTVTSCTFIDNTSHELGGGMYNASSNPSVTDCTFSSNNSVFDAGGMGNSSSSPTVTNCTFTQNTASGSGGGMDSTGGSPTVTNCTFTGNTSAGAFQANGGGMHNSRTSPRVTNCTFTQNTAAYFGGGMDNDASSPTVTNCAFIGNTGYFGGGMLNEGISIPSVSNCTFSMNTSVGDGGGGMDNGVTSVVVTNCIFWGNTGKGSNGIFGGAHLTYSDVQDYYSNATPDANGNFTANPLFVDPANGDLHLTAASPCRNSGNNTVILSPPFLTVSGTIVDLDGNPRIVENIVDLGAYEFQNRPPILTVPTSINGTVGQPVTFTASATAPFPTDTLTFSLVNPPAGASINSATGQVTFLTSVAGTYSLQVKVTETLGLSDTRSVQVVIASNPTGTARVLMTNLQISRLNATTITVSFNLLNSGTAAAQSMRVTAAKLKGIASSALVGPFSIPAGNSQNVTLTFFSSTLTPGSAVFTISGSYTGGGFSSGLNLALP